MGMEGSMSELVESKNLYTPQHTHTHGVRLIPSHTYTYAHHTTHHTTHLMKRRPAGRCPLSLTHTPDEEETDAHGGDDRSEDQRCDGKLLGMEARWRRERGFRV